MHLSSMAEPGARMADYEKGKNHMLLNSRILVPMTINFLAIVTFLISLLLDYDGFFYFACGMGFTSAMYQALLFNIRSGYDKN